ncbi:hypothetical protein ACW5WQ_14215 [Aeromonas rivuli]|nr:hypothetical protein [Aeromonas rivuli]
MSERVSLGKSRATVQQWFGTNRMTLTPLGLHGWQTALDKDL